MKNNVLFINEDYYRKYFATKRTLDDDQIVSLIRMTQVTAVVDLLSTSLYEHIHTKLDEGTTLTEPESRMFEDLQLFIGLKVSIKYDLQSPERGSDESWDKSTASTEGELKIVSARITRIINADEAMSTIAENSTEVVYDSSPINNQGGGFYFEDSF